MSPRTQENDRPPREKMYEKETEQIIYRIRNRADQRIGQLLLKAVRKQADLASRKDVVSNEKPSAEMTDEEFEKHLKELEQLEAGRKAKTWDILWNMEAPELLKTLEKVEEK